MTFMSPLLLLMVVTCEIHLEDIFGALPYETLDAHQRVLEEELIHMLLILIVEVSQMVQYTLDLTSLLPNLMTPFKGEIFKNT